MFAKITHFFKKIYAFFFQKAEVKNNKKKSIKNTVEIKKNKKTVAKKKNMIVSLKKVVKK